MPVKHTRYNNDCFFLPNYAVSHSCLLASSVEEIFLHIHAHFA